MRVFFASAAICLALTANAASAQDKKLNGREIQATFSGVTMSEDRGMHEYHSPDGVAILREREDGKIKVRAGSWRVVSNTICYRYLDIASEEYCWRVFRMADGAHILWGTENQIIIEVDLNKGDTRKLESSVSSEVRAAALALR